MGIVFDGVDLEDQYSVYALGRMTYGAPEKDVELVHVPGRSGDVILDNKAYHNMTIVYPDCWIIDDFPGNSAGLRDHLMKKTDYCELRDDYHPGEYRMALYKGPFEPEAVSGLNNSAGRFDLSFVCQPQRWLDSGKNLQTLTMTQEGSAYVCYCDLPSIYADIADIQFRFQAEKGAVVTLKVGDTTVTMSGFTSTAYYAFRQVASTGRQYFTEAANGVVISGDILTAQRTSKTDSYTVRATGVSAIDYMKIATHAYRM